MGKAFMVSLYFGLTQPDRLAEYADPVRTAIEANGGRFIVCGQPAHTYEDGLSERTIIIEFASVEQADQPNMSGYDKQIIDGRMKTCKTHYQTF